MTAYDELIAKAGATGSSAVVVTKGAETIVDWTDADGHRPTETMSVTKMVVAIVTGVGLRDVGPEVLTVPASRWITEWKDDERSRITVPQLLNHHSGLACIPALEASAKPDAVAAALELQLEREPGAQHVYNNLAINLVGEIVRRATSERIDTLAGKQIFEPLGFGPWEWLTDEVGNPRCHWGLKCRADDLAKVGRLLLEPRDVVPDWWVKATFDLYLSCYPQSAWMRANISSSLVDRWREAGVDPDLIKPIAHVVDQEMDFDALQEAIVEAVGERWPDVLNAAITRGLPWFDGEFGPDVAHGHDGDGGQRLIVMPDRDAVAVRQREDLESGSYWSNFAGDAYEVAA